MSSQEFIIHPRNVVSEIIDGEAVIINLETGIYYSMNQIGAEIWRLFENKMSVPNILQTLLARYQEKRSVVEKELNELLSDLEHEGLILSHSEASNAEKEAPSPTVHQQNGAKLSFKNPKLEKYTDMQDFLLVDPIHEVDEKGWPHKKEESPVSNS